MNTQRGEVKIEVDGVEYNLLPSFEALNHIENLTGRGAYALPFIFTGSPPTARLKDIAAVVYACHWHTSQAKRASDLPWSFTRLEKLIYEQGFFKMASACAELVSAMTIGAVDGDDSKNSQPASE